MHAELRLVSAWLPAYFADIGPMGPYRARNLQYVAGTTRSFGKSSVDANTIFPSVCWQ
jgi:hypothetical protein